MVFMHTFGNHEGQGCALLIFWVKSVNGVIIEE